MKKSNFYSYKYCQCAVLFFAFIVFAFFSVKAYSAEKKIIDLPPENIRMVVGDIQFILTDGLTRISIVNPSIADTLDISVSEITVLAKRQGRTEMFLWDNTGKRTVRVWVFQEMLDIVEERLRELLRVSDIQGLRIEKNEIEGKIVVDGELDPNYLKRYQDIVKPFEDSIINLVREKEERDLIEISVQIAEVNVDYAQHLGVFWETTAFDYSESLPTLEKTIDFFKIGQITRQTPITATINALASQGKAKILSRPKLVVRSGESASFHVGGEIPIRTTTSTTTTTTESISFRSYGVQLTIRPSVQDKNKIDIDLTVDVSDIDESVRVGDDVGYINRSAQTKLFLENNQPIVLAGFIKENKSETIRRVPFLGSIPVIGLLFRDRSAPENKTELFITLTPRILTLEEKEAEKEPQVAKDNLRALEESAVSFYKKDIAQNFIIESLEQESNIPFEKEEEPEILILQKDSIKEELLVKSDDFLVAQSQEKKETKILLSDQDLEKDVALASSKDVIESQIQEKKNKRTNSQKQKSVTDVETAEKEIFLLASAAETENDNSLERLPVGQPDKPQEQEKVIIFESAAHPASELKMSLAPYARGIQEKIADAVQYPFAAQQALQQGTVEIELFLSRTGVLISSSVIRSSGHPLLDQAALKAAVSSSPFDRFPKDIQNESLTITIPIVYQLD